jgi:hypothetical protein
LVAVLPTAASSLQFAFVGRAGAAPPPEKTHPGSLVSDVVAHSIATVSRNVTAVHLIFVPQSLFMRGDPTIFASLPSSAMAAGEVNRPEKRDQAHLFDDSRASGIERESWQ